MLKNIKESSLTNDVFKSSFNRLPPSSNNYLKPRLGYAGNGKPYAYMYETKMSKDFKKAFREHLLREIIKTGWKKEITKENQWVLEVSFVQSNMSEDSNNYFKILLDAMTGYIYEDDNNIKPRVMRVTYNKENPSFSFVLRQTSYRGMFKDENTRSKMIEKQCTSCRFYRDGSCSVLKKLTQGKELEEYNQHENTCGKYIKRKGS